MAKAADAYDLPIELDDGCPCFEWRTDDLYAKAHCWRGAFYDEKRGRPCGCPGAGVHVFGRQKDAQRLAKLLTAMDWGGTWQAFVEGPFSKAPAPR